MKQITIDLDTLSDLIWSHLEDVVPEENLKHINKKQLSIAVWRSYFFSLAK
jgi:hypothetical protein